MRLTACSKAVVMLHLLMPSECRPQLRLSGRSRREERPLGSLSGLEKVGELMQGWCSLCLTQCRTAALLLLLFITTYYGTIIVETMSKRNSLSGIAAKFKLFKDAPMQSLGNGLRI